MLPGSVEDRVRDIAIRTLDLPAPVQSEESKEIEEPQAIDSIPEERRQAVENCKQNALGVNKWRETLGDPGDEDTAFPKDIDSILAQPDPDDSTRCFAENYVLVLIPKKVDNTPLTFTQLCSLAKSKKGVKIKNDANPYLEGTKNNSPRKSYWLLVSKKLCRAKKSSILDIDDQLPTLLENSVLIVMQELSPINDFDKWETKELRSKDGANSATSMWHKGSCTLGAMRSGGFKNLYGYVVRRL